MLPGSAQGRREPRARGPRVHGQTDNGAPPGEGTVLQRGWRVRQRARRGDAGMRLARALL